MVRWVNADSLICLWPVQFCWHMYLLPNNMVNKSIIWLVTLCILLGCKIYSFCILYCDICTSVEQWYCTNKENSGLRNSHIRLWHWNNVLLLWYHTWWLLQQIIKDSLSTLLTMGRYWKIAHPNIVYYNRLSSGHIIIFHIGPSFSNIDVHSFVNSNTHTHTALRMTDVFFSITKE